MVFAESRPWVPNSHWVNAGVYCASGRYSTTSPGVSTRARRFPYMPSGVQVRKNLACSVIPPIHREMLAEADPPWVARIGGKTAPAVAGSRKSRPLPILTGSRAGAGSTMRLGAERWKKQQR